MNEFLTQFWANFLANLAVVATLSTIGYFAKNQIVKNIKQFIDKQVISSISVIEKEKEKGNSK